MPGLSSRLQSLVINYLLSLPTLISDITDDDNFSSMLDNRVQVSALKSVNVKSKQGKAVGALALEKRCII